MELDQFEFRLTSEVPDALFPTDNEWGIPILDKHLQAECITLPFTGWGKLKRSDKIVGGTYHFYVDDYRFTALWKWPQQLLYSQCSCAVEPNFTLSLNSPQAYVEWCVYRKRWMARFWQMRGVRIWVDLNVPTEFNNLLFAGVPHEWRAYMTRGYQDRIEATYNEFESACDHHGDDDILFAVYGGGIKVRDYCKGRGWQWLPEDRDVVKGRVFNG